jgi:pimeloyl-ACP methyl ester carboxylesterase
MPYVTNRGVRIHYEVEGAGQPLVLQHGYTLNSELWYRFGYVDALKPHFRLVLVDARGHGARSYVWPISVADILAVVDDLGIERVACWGYSMGGAIVLGLAQHAPNRVSALIVGGATAYPRSLQTLPDGNNPEAFISMIGGRASPFRSYCCRATCAPLQQRRRIGPSCWMVCRKMRMPCLFYAGESDGIFANARTTAQQVPNACFCLIAEPQSPGGVLSRF